MSMWQILEKYSYYTLTTIAGLLALLKEENIDPTTALEMVNKEIETRNTRMKDNINRRGMG